MKHMTLENIATACGGQYFGSDSNKKKEVKGVVIDSRLIEADFLFIPMSGERVDGHSFIPQVMEQGALCTLSEHELVSCDFSYILVESTAQALKDIAEFYRSVLDIKVVGITGSVGKTSTKEMIASVLSQKYKVLKTEGNYNNEIGLPLTIFKLNDSHEIAVLEMGINHFGEMERLSKVAKPDIAVITNIGFCHLEFLHNREGVLKAKSEIFKHLNPNNGKIILNGEDDLLITLQDVDGIRPIFFGLADEHSIYADNIINLGLDGTKCDIILDENLTISPKIPIPGPHMVLNALAGAAIGHTLSLTPTEIKNGIESLLPVSGRNNIIKSDQYTVIDDCYNANPVSMKASLDVLSTAIGRKVAILGDMGELGKNEFALHEEVGIHAAYNEIDVICCIGTLSYHTYLGALTALAKSKQLGDCQAYYFETKEEFLKIANQILEPADTILIKASNFMKFKDIVTHTINNI